jgi:hypothetical protein
LNEFLVLESSIDSTVDIVTVVAGGSKSWHFIHPRGILETLKFGCAVKYANWGFVTCRVSSLVAPPP